MDLQIKGIKLPPLSQVGIVVGDIDRAVEYYQRVLGIGPFEFREVTRPDAVYKGRVSPYRVRLAFAQLGPVQMELIQVVEGETTQTEFLSNKGEGLHHLGFRVDDLDEEIAKLEKVGIGVIQTHRIGKAGFAYMDTEGIGGVIVELIQAPRQNP